jgi:uncharacterized membrane protein YfcA
MNEIVSFILLGLIAGVVSGLIGIGGGVLMIPVLVLLFGFSQHQAQGTTLAMFVLPIGLAAALSYYQKGYVNLYATLLLSLGFVVGGFIGGKLAVNLSDTTLRISFGTFLLLIALKMLFYK